jgi:CSLREA domain-containing protein
VVRRIKVSRARAITPSLLLGLSLVGLSLMLARPPMSRAATTLTVNSTADDGTGTCTASKCTLRDAILSAASGDTITFSLPANSTITLTSGELLINKNLTINGPGANLLTVQRSTTSGIPDFRIFHIAADSFNVTISGLTISNGSARSNDYGGGIYSESSGTVSFTNGVASGNSAGFGGGLLNLAGTMNVTGCTISGNTIYYDGGGIFNYGGTLTLTNSTIAGNTAGSVGGGRGGGIYNYGGTLTLTNSTIAGNTAGVGVGAGGGGILNGGGTVTLTNSTISGNSADRGGGILNGGGTVTLTNSTISGNSGRDGGGIYNNSSGSSTVNLTSSTISGNSASFGGGIESDGGTVTITNSTISGNTAGGGILIGGGTVTIINSTIAGNTTGSSGGGGIYNYGGTLMLTNSTIAGNTAGSGGSGGGIFNDGGGTVNLTNSTISGNSSSNSEGGGIFNQTGTVTATNSTISNNSASAGGGIRNAGGTVNARNTIIAKNTVTALAPDFVGTLNSQGFNLIGNSSGTNITPTTGDQIGTPASPIDPKLETDGTGKPLLKNNGGPTQTIALLPGSTAIDKGQSRFSSTDQRGFTRPIDTPAIANAGDGSDIGAYEVQPDQLIGCSEINLVVNNNSDGSAGSLRAVIASACGGSTITFAANVRGTIALTSAELLINKNLTISGPGANLLSVQRSAAGGTPAFRIFNIAANFNVAISGLTITNGSAPGNFGGGISNNGSTVAITNCAVSGNAAASGGGIYNNGATLTITNSTISGNSGNGGGIFNDAGTVTITSSTISGNSAQFFGGGIYNFSSMRITNSTIAGNTAGSSGGGGIYNDSNGTVTVRNTLIALNTSASGPDVKGALISQGYNLIGNSSGATISPTPYPDQIGVTAAQLNLGPLQDNGGPTKTHALLSGSTAIDKGDSGGTSTDQRGFARPVGIANVSGGDGSDIGAFEVQATPTLQFSSTTYSVNENAGTATISVTRANDTSVAATVNYATSNGTATAGADYTATSGTLSFASGDVSKTFSITIINDSLNEPNETVNLTLSSVTGNAALGTPSTAVLTIVDDDPLPGLSINDVSVAEGNSGTTNANFTVSLSAASGQTVTVNYATANGTATAGSDYVATSGTLTFTPGQTSKPITVTVIGDTTVEPDETFFVDLSSPTNAAITRSRGTGTIINDDNPLVSNLQFSTTSYSVDEGGSSTTITVTRTGDTSGTVTVDYQTSDLSAQQRTDYTIGAGTVTLGPGETSKSFVVLIVNDLYVEGNEVLNLALSNPTGGAALVSPSVATLTIIDNDSTSATTNPLDDARFFVQQHYYDFLSRYPDASGWDFWTSQITQCGTDATCLRNKRIDVSNAYFYELEYQQTGAYVFRLYRAAFGNTQPFPNPDGSNSTEANKLPSYAKFAFDRARVVGGSSLAQGQLDFATVFVQRAEFKNKYSVGLDGPGFVDALLLTIKNDLSVDLGSQRTALLDLFNQNGGGTAGLGAVLYRLADDNAQTNPINNRAFIDEEYNRAFVATQYFGYLRRDPDIGGFLFWLGQVSSAPLRDVTKQHAMVCSFITSDEYQQRFSPVVTHSNAECTH